MIAAEPAPRGAPGAGTRACPGPNGHPIWGCLPELNADPFEFYRRMYREYGEVVRIPTVPGIPVYLLAHPDAVEHVLVGSHKNYAKLPIIKSSFGLLGGKGMFADEGESWFRKRKLAQPAFARQRVLMIAGPVEEASNRVADRWESSGEEVVLDVLPELMNLSLAIAGLTLFGVDISGEADVLGLAYREAFEYIGFKMKHPFHPPLWFPTSRNRRFNRVKKEIDRVVDEIISGRRNNPTGRDDLLDRLMAATDEDSKTGLSDRELLDEVITLLTAGHETVGATLGWAFSLLAKHPEVQTKAAEEARSGLGERATTISRLQRLTYCTAVVQETLRLHPPAWSLPRMSLAKDEVLGVEIPKGAAVVLPQYIIHERPEFWTDPEVFRPERFLGENPEPNHPHAYFPFGVGPRVCIGNQFALIEATLVLASLLRRFEVVEVPGHPIEPDATFTLRPKHGVKLTIRRRPGRSDLSP